MSSMRRKVPFRQQMADADCGPACLAMVLGKYRHDISVYSARVLCEAYGPPQSVRSLIAAARSVGMEASLAAASIDMLGSTTGPCILHWNFNHFVVLERLSKGRYVICDPALGRRYLTRDELSNSFTGLIVTMTPSPDFKKQKLAKNHNFRAYIYTALRESGAGRALILIIFTALLVQGVSLLAPLLTMYLVDVVVPANAIGIHKALLLLICLGAISVALLSYLRARVIVVLQTAIDKALLAGFVAHILKLPVQFFLERSVGDIQSRMNSSTVVRDATSSYAVTSLLDALMGFVYLAVVISISPLYAALTASFAFAQLGLHLLENSKLKEKLAAEVKTQAIYQSYAQEIIGGMSTIKATSSEEEVEETWRRKLNNYLVASKQRSYVDGSVTAGSTAIRTVAPALLLWFSVLLYLNQKVSFGEVFAVNTISAMALIPLTSLMSTVRYGQLLKAHTERLSDVWLHARERVSLNESPDLKGPGSISFKNVDFRYKTSRDSALKNVSLKIPLGKRTGIVGPSGSGKSTLVSLLMGFHDPNNGAIEINGVDLKQINIESFRKQVGFVTQSTFLFNGSVRRNVSLGASNASIGDIQRAIQVAGLGDYVKSLPMELEALVGNDGSSLSGGQRQRLAIARAIVRSPRLLILDEATSSLDSATELVISNALANQGCTQLIISHRLSTVRNCDLIYVIEEGTVSDYGNHEELLLSSSYYRNCYYSQGLNSSPSSNHQRVEG